MQRIFGPPFSSIPMQPPIPFQSGFMPMSGGMSQVAPLARAGISPMGQAFGGSQAMRGGGGFLAKLFGGGTNSVGMASSQVASGGMNLSTILTNTQRVLGITQQVMPMVQQYGPIVRNIPTIWRIMRTPSDSPQDIQPVTNVNNEVTSLPDQSLDLIEFEQLKPISLNIDGMPTPKLYV